MIRRQVLKGLSSAGLGSVFLNSSMTPVAQAQPAKPTASKTWTVMTSSGPVTGSLQEGIGRFLGIPYGQAQRFQAPTAYPNWSKPLEAYDYGPACPQGKSLDPRASEACQVLNLWAPKRRDPKAPLLPIMVYIHGGAYMSGSGASPLYEGSALADFGQVIVITLNHRLNALGYLYLGRAEREIGGERALYQASGNAGQLDLILALQWIRQNAAVWGGDASRLMVFGQSGGGAKIATLMATPRAKGLFQRAATMSGQQVTASGPNNAHTRTQALFKALGLSLNSEGLRHMSELPLTDLLAGMKTTDPIIGTGGLYFGPVLDEVILKHHPFYPDAAAQSLDIPMIIGNTHDETRAFLGHDEANHHLSFDDLPQKLSQQLRVDIDPYEVVETYRRLYPNLSASDLFFAATTAGRSWRGAIIEAEARARAQSPAFVYQLNWKTPLDGGKWGAPHTLDIPLVFRNTSVPSPANEGYCQDGPEARLVSDHMSKAFISLAYHGTPQGPDHGPEIPPEWQPYDLEKRQTMIFDTVPRLENDPRGDERRLFEKVPFIQQGT